MTKGRRTKKYFGICLSGGKNEKTFIARIDEYIEGDKLVLTSISQAPQGDTKTSSDKLLIDYFKRIKGSISIGVDAPTTLPVCIRYAHKKNYDSARAPAVKYMWELYRKKQKNKSVFAPYTERPVEYFINSIQKDVFLSGALGANFAPLTARAIYLQKHFKGGFKEVFPKLSFLRLSRALGLEKKYLSVKRLSEQGDEARWQFLKRLIDTDMVFMYNQDVQLMVDNPYAFDAFLVALTLVLEARGLTEPKPKNFPKGEGWILFPVEHIEF